MRPKGITDRGESDTRLDGEESVATRSVPGAYPIVGGKVIKKFLLWVVKTYDSAGRVVKIVNFMLQEPLQTTFNLA